MCQNKQIILLLVKSQRRMLKKSYVLCISPDRLNYGVIMLKPPNLSSILAIRFFSFLYYVPITGSAGDCAPHPLVPGLRLRGHPLHRTFPTTLSGRMEDAKSFTNFSYICLTKMQTITHRFHCPKHQPQLAVPAKWDNHKYLTKRLKDDHTHPPNVQCRKVTTSTDCIRDTVCPSQRILIC